MTNNDANNPFNWLNVHPRFWATTEGVYPQKCPTCHEEMQGTNITNARGFYQHYHCAYKLFNEFWRSQSINHMKKREFDDLLHTNPMTSYLVSYNPTQNNRIGRYSVMEFGW